MKYINSYLSKKCSSDLQPLFCQSKNPLKEISESYGAYKNMVPFLDTKNKCIANLFIGDGSLCMTGFLFSFLTKNYSISIDPLINKDKICEFQRGRVINNFMFNKGKFENFDAKSFPIKYSFDYYNIILVHSHVNVVEVIKKFPNWKYMYSNPCCKPSNQTFSIQQQKEFNISVVSSGKDENILSEKNEIVMYRNNNKD
jgi:hypothetical protein